MSPNRVIRKKIGELLLERKVITKQQLEQALQIQKEKGGFISQHLIVLGFTTEIEIANCLSSQYGFPYLPLTNYIIPAETLNTVPLKFIKVYSIIPVDKIGNLLTIAMADPLNDGVIEMLKQITNCDVEVFISTYGEIKQAIRRYYGDKLQAMEVTELQEEDLLKAGIVHSFIQTKGYQGDERRKHQRIDVELTMSYFLQGKVFEAKVRNLSYIGMFFICESFIALDTDVLCKIALKDDFVDAVIEVARVERIKEIQHVDEYEVTKWEYGIAGFFSFITDEDRNKLAEYLKSIIRKEKTGG
ncbi:MAG: PilZ domain-containing protein [Candidatus Omnitrophica bacterium]|nr:PilZ domain-containing protein [Candidatus Omnitrophota bacterium]